MGWKYYFFFCPEDLKHFLIDDRKGPGVGAKSPDEIMDIFNGIAPVDAAVIRMQFGCLYE